MKKILVMLLLIILVVVAGCKGGKNVPPKEIDDTTEDLGVDELAENIDALDDLEDLEEPEISPDDLDLN